MALGFPTILIPAIQGGNGPNNADNDGFSHTKEEISWISKANKFVLLIYYLFLVYKLIECLLNTGSINLLCVPIGCVFSGVFTEILGKRKAMQVNMRNKLI